MNATSVRELLEFIAAHEGKIEVGDVDYYPIDREAEALGLLDRDDQGSGWGVTTILTLTNNGRRMLGLEAITPAQKKSVATRLLEVVRSLIGPKPTLS